MSSFAEYLGYLSPKNATLTLKYTADGEQDANKILQKIATNDKKTIQLEQCRAYIKWLRYCGKDTSLLDEKLLYLSEEYHESLGYRKDAKELVELYRDKKYKEYVALFLQKNYDFTGEYVIVETKSHKKYLNYLFLSKKYVIFHKGDNIFRIYHQKFTDSVRQLLKGSDASSSGDSPVDTPDTTSTT